MPAKKTSDSEPNVDETQNIEPTTIENQDVVQTEQASTDAPVVSGKSTAELANDVLHGRFGDFNVVRENLEKAGADVTAVMSLVNDRLGHGAPSSYRPNISQVLDSAKRGEWGDKNVALRIRHAGFSETDALHVETSLNQEK